MTHGSLFSGIGGFDLAAEWMGWENVFHCEINPFSRQVSHYYWPNATSYEDITTTDFTIWRGLIDVLTGGFPCQPYSTAGKRLGKEDSRHLWPEMLRAIQEISPRWVVGENVRGLISWNGGMVFDEVQADLEAQDYEVLPFLLPACAVNAPHRRDRIWFIAYAKSDRSNRASRIGSKTIEGPDGSAIEQPGIGGSVRTAADTSGIRGRKDSKGRLDELRELLQNKGREKDTNKSFGYGQRSVVTHTEKSDEQRDRLPPACGQEEIGGCDSEIDATNPHSQQRCEGRMHPERSETTERHFGSCDPRNGGGAWSNFPTQPPVRSRNDGLPSRLVGITVSKHRNESLKAYGNAIVPQVAYQIFKAIQQYDL